jgi:hypothetical protein
MKTESVLAAIVALALFFKFILLWPIANQLIILSLSILSMIYMFGSVYFFSYKKVNHQNFAVTILGGLGMSVALTGIMFKVMYWPGAQPMILISLMSIVPILIISLVSGNNLVLSPTITREEEIEKISNLINYYKNLRIRTIVITLCTILFFITPMSALINLQHRNDPEMARLKLRSYENIQNEEYRRELNEYVRKKQKE